MINAPSNGSVCWCIIAVPDTSRYEYELICRVQHSIIVFGGTHVRKSASSRIESDSFPTGQRLIYHSLNDYLSGQARVLNNLNWQATRERSCRIANISQINFEFICLIGEKSTREDHQGWSCSIGAVLPLCSIDWIIKRRNAEHNCPWYERNLPDCRTKQVDPGRSSRDSFRPNVVPWMRQKYL